MNSASVRVSNVRTSVVWYASEASVRLAEYRGGYRHRDRDRESEQSRTVEIQY